MKIEVLRTGTWTDSSGKGHTFEASDLDRIVKAYAERQNDAPIVVGHPATNDPAYGWVESLQRDKDRLVATLKDVVPQFANLVRQKLYKYVSVSLSGDKLRHVGFLGAVPPAVEGLKPASFAEESADAVCIDFAQEDLNKNEEGNVDELQKLQSENQRLKKQLADAEAKEKAKSAMAFAEKLVTEGKVLPRQKDQLLEVIMGMDRLPADFSEGGAIQTKFREFLAGMPAKIALGEYSGKAGKTDFADRVDALMTARKMNYSDAVKQILREEEGR